MARVGAVAPTFAAVLEGHRDRYNALFLSARRTLRSLTPEDFRSFLECEVEPNLLAASSGVAPGELQELMDALYELALEVVGNGLGGPGGRHSILARLWRDFLPTVAPLWRASPRDAIAALCNGAVNLSAEPGVDEEAWLDALTEVAPRTRSLSELLEAGQVLAWKAGMAHYREGALRIVATLPPHLGEALEVDAGALEARWPRGERAALRSVAEVGDFHGFGGFFDAPPEVMQAGGQLFAFDNRGCWTIHADRFGVTLKRYGSTLPDAPKLPGPFRVDGGEVRVEGSDTTFLAPVPVRSWAGNDELAALTSPHSHRILLVALADG